MKERPPAPTSRGAEKLLPRPPSERSPESWKTSFLPLSASRPLFSEHPFQKRVGWDCKLHSILSGSVDSGRVFLYPSAKEEERSIPPRASQTLQLRPPSAAAATAAEARDKRGRAAVCCRLGSFAAAAPSPRRPPSPLPRTPSRQKAERRKSQRGRARGGGRAALCEGRGSQDGGAAHTSAGRGQGRCMSRLRLHTGLAAVNERLPPSPSPPPPPPAAAAARLVAQLPLSGHSGSLLRISRRDRLFFGGDLLKPPRFPCTFLFVCVL